MIKLYPYQAEAVKYAVDNLFERQNSLIVAGTGAGKTIMLASVVGKFTTAFKAIKGHYPHTLVLVHRTEIHNQNTAKFSLVCPSIPTSEITATRKSVKGLVHFGMVQTVVNIIDKLPVFDLIVIDEAHHSAADTYKQIIEKNKEKGGVYLLGVTATPNRGDKLPLIELFDNFTQITTRYLIDSHYLVPPEFIDLSPRFGNEVGRLQKNIRKDLLSDVVEKLISKFLERKAPGKSVIFAPSHEFCQIIKNVLESNGKKPSYLMNNMSAEIRASEIERFECGDAEELINVDIATEGYDYPPIANVVEFDTNGSETQWVQKVGRGLRTSEGKTFCRVIDFGGNIVSYPDVEIDVNLNGNYKAPLGTRLSLDNFFQSNDKEKEYKEVEFAKSEKFTPYAPPEGWETLNDQNRGIVYVACGKSADFIISRIRDMEYVLFYTDKNSAVKPIFVGEFSDCMEYGVKIADLSDLFNKSNKNITKMQIKRLAPKYPTASLSWYTATCAICWETWKYVIEEVINNGI